MMHTQRGITLVEALVGFLVLSLGLLGAARLQSWLHLNGDVARQRTEAVRLAEQDMEQVRSFANAAGFNAIATRQIQASGTSATFTLMRTVATLPDSGLKGSTVSVSWHDRSGASQAIHLQSNVADESSVYSAALALPMQDRVVALRRRMPSGSMLLGDGRSVLKPVANGDVAWVIDNASGSVTAQCKVNATIATQSISASDLSGCVAITANLLSGYIRFSLGNAPDATNPNDAPLPLALDLALDAISAPKPSCHTDPVKLGAERYVAYHCLVQQTASDAGWSGELRIVPIGWAFGTDATSRKACRYATNHPAHYSGVHGPLLQQNYLIIRGDLACPAALTPHNGTSVATVQYQPGTL